MSQIQQRKTKIVATIGPASSSEEIIEKMINAGVNLFRFNFSHGTHDEHSALLDKVRSISKKYGLHIGILQDLCGPKMRINALDEGVVLEEGAEVKLKYDQKKQGNAKTIYLNIFKPEEVFKVGETALLADGRIELQASSIKKDHIIAKVTAGGPLRGKSGIILPDSDFSLPCLTEKDLIDLQWGIDNNADYIALSFVSSAKDVYELKNEIKARGGRAKVVAKIERAIAVQKIVEIVEASDAVMVARGDLGLELPLEKVPSAQKLIIETANMRGKPAITATQMLQSMVTEVRPTRAEVTDVSSAVRDGTDAVMLSEETAIGKHPHKVIAVFDKILKQAEIDAIYGIRESFDSRRIPLRTDWSSVTDAICSATATAAEKISASAIIICTLTGQSARLMAKYRPTQPMYGITSEENSLTSMSLFWGVTPIKIEIEQGASREEEIIASMKALLNKRHIKPGARITITTGSHAKYVGSTNSLEIREVPFDLGS